MFTNRFNPKLIQEKTFIDFISDQIVHESGHITLYKIGEGEKTQKGYDYLQSKGVICKVSTMSKTKRYVLRAINTIINRDNLDDFYAHELVTKVTEMIGRTCNKNEIAQALRHFTVNDYLTKHKDYTGKAYLYYQTSKPCPLKTYE